MSELVVISKDDLSVLIAQAVERGVSSVLAINEKKIKAPKKSKTEETLEELDNWVVKEVAWKKMGITRRQWYDKYQHIIKHKPYAGSTWVYLPSILEFFQNECVN